MTSASYLETMIVRAAEDGVAINTWPTQNGNFQANVRESGTSGWTCVLNADPLDALREALRLISTGVATRTVVTEAQATQIEMLDRCAATGEDYVPSATTPPPTPPIDLEDMLG